MRRFFVTVVLVALLVVAVGCTSTGSNTPAFTAGSGKLKVATSFYPMYEVTRLVGGDKVDVVNMVPAGTEPHDWEPTAKHMKTLNEAAVFVYNGLGMEHWVEKTLKNVENKSLLAVEASNGFDLLKAEGHAQDDGHGHDEPGEFDPHVWLDPTGVAHQVAVVRDALVKADPANQSTYVVNASAYMEKLNSLDQEFKAALSGCATKEFFTSHSAFGYLARRYGLEQHGIMGLAPDAEPKPKEMAKIVEEAKAHNVKYIFFETLASDKVADAVAKEIGAQTLVLNPLEGLTDAEMKAGKSYLSVMRENLANLKTALECGK